MSKPIVRPFKPDDIEAVVEIANLSWQHIYASHREIFGDELYDTLFPEDQERKGNQVRSTCEREPEQVWICELDGKVVGFINWFIDDNKKIGEIGNNGVHPDFVGKGLGSLMYKSVLEHFREIGMCYAKVNTGLDDAHAPARRAYERMGFNIRQEFVNYYMHL